MVKQYISNERLERLNKVLAEQIGIVHTPDRLVDLERSLGHITKEFGFNDIDECVNWLTCRTFSDEQVKLLSLHLTVGETYFYRDPELFQLLESQVLPELIERRRPMGKYLRIWSAACSTGEEPYTIAMILKKLLPDWQSWQIDILGTDINTTSLDKARMGKFSQWSFRNCEPGMVAEFFTKNDTGAFILNQSIKDMVRFSWLNLADAKAYEALVKTASMDIIFLRNVLIYFDRDAAALATTELRNRLAADGYMFVSANEMLMIDKEHFKVAQSGNTMFLRKGCAEETLLTTNDSDPIFSDWVNHSLPFSDQTITFDQREILEQEPPSLENTNNELASVILHSKIPVAAYDKLDPFQYYLKAAVLQDQGDNAAAILALRQSLFLNPKYVMAVFALGNILATVGKLKESSKHLANAHQLLLAYKEDDVLPGSDGITAGALLRIIRSFGAEVIK